MRLQLTSDAITTMLRTNIIGKKTMIFEQVDSTNTYAKKIANEGFEEGTLIVAEEQTAGRGRFGRTWVSQKYKNLTFSILLKPKVSQDKLGMLSLVAGIAVVRAIQSTTQLPATCKWPNDVLINGKKMCGILSEVVKDSQGNTCVIVGIGINVNQAEFPEELQSTASSLALELGNTVDRLEILSSVLHELEDWYLKFQSGNFMEIIEEWKKNSTMIGQQISINQNGTILTGIASGIADDGALLLQSNNTIIKVFAGDITIMKEKR